MPRFLLPEPVVLEDAVSLISLVAKLERLGSNHKAVVCVRLGLTPDAWAAANKPEILFWARAIAEAREDELYVGKSPCCGPLFRFLPGVLSNPPEGLCVEAMLRLGQIKICPSLFPHGSIEAGSADWYLWLRPGFCHELLRRNPSQRDVDNVCDSIVARAMSAGMTHTRAELISAVQSALSDAKKKQANEYWRRHHGPWKAGPGRRREKKD